MLEIGLDYKGLNGTLSSKTDSVPLFKTTDGIVQNIKTTNVISTKQLPNSMMPTGLMEGMTKDEAVDLVEYLVGLKKK